MDQRGSVEIIVVFGMVALLAAAALVLDFGLVAVDKIKLQNALQNAALSGAHFLTESETAARAVALDYFEANGEDKTLATVTVLNNNRRIEVSSTQTVDFFIARVLGFNSTTITGKATAIIGPIKSVTSGVRPLGVENIAYSYGDQIVLKEDAGSGVYGNYGSIALGGSGSSIYINNLLYGYSGKVSIGEAVPTEPGNKASAIHQLKTYLNSAPETFSNYSKDSKRLWTLPLVERYDPNGREDITVVGFAKFFIEDIQLKAGQAEVTGRFVQYVDLGEVDPTLEITGLYGVKLIR